MGPLCKGCGRSNGPTLYSRAEFRRVYSDAGGIGADMGWVKRVQSQVQVWQRQNIDFLMHYSIDFLHTNYKVKRKKNIFEISIFLHESQGNRKKFQIIRVVHVTQQGVKK